VNLSADPTKMGADDLVQLGVNPEKLKEVVEKKESDKAPEAKQELPHAPCARCGWASKEVPSPEPTAEDKFELIRALTSTGLFRKEYVLFGGAVRVALTDLTRDTHDKASQVAHDEFRAWLDENKNVTDTAVGLMLQEKVIRATDLRTAASVESVLVRTPGQELYKTAYTRPASCDPKTAYDALNTTVFSSVVMWGAVSAVAQELQTLLSTCRTRAYDPNFWLASTAAG